MDNDTTHHLLRAFPFQPAHWVPGIWKGFPAIRDRRDRVCWAGINDNWSATRYEVQEQGRRYCRMLDGMKTDRMRLDTLRPEQQAPRFMLSTLVATGVARARLRAVTP